MAFPVRHHRERDVAAWNPVAELEQTTKRLARLLDEAWDSRWPAMGLHALDEFMPAADIEETDEAYVVEIELPGVKRQDVNVEVTGRRLTVSGERKQRERTGILRRQTRTVGRFLYEAVLPSDVDEEAVTAHLAEGVLTVTLAKNPSERRRRRTIPID